MIFSDVCGHIINGHLELQPMASVNLVKAMLLELNGVEVDGWKIKVIVGWRWAWRVSFLIIKGLGWTLVNLWDLWLGPAWYSILSRIVSFTELRSGQLARKFLPPALSTPSTHFAATYQHDRFARQLYKMLRSNLPSETHTNGAKEGEKDATVTFSAISAPLVLLSTVTLCRLPFFLRVPLSEPTPSNSA